MSEEAIYSPSLQSITRRLFIAEEFHQLNVSRVETVEVWDIFDCALKCVRNPLCFSMNLAASKAADGKLWFELLSSDKYRDTAEYRGNTSAHHYRMEAKKVFSACGLLLVLQLCESFTPELQNVFLPLFQNSTKRRRLPLDMQCPGFFVGLLVSIVLTCVT